MQTKSEINKEEIAIQGFAGSFHHIAARHYFGSKSQAILPCHTFNDLVATVKEKGNTGMLAIENALVGSIMGNYQLLNDPGISTIGEVYLRISQNLMALPGTRIEDLKRVESHPMALAQCAGFFEDYPTIKLVETEDTAGSAQKIREAAKEKTGAIASTLAAELNQLQILAPSIESHKENFTRFLVIAPRRDTQEGKKASICFSLPHKPGSLSHLMSAIAKENIDLTKIQSVPIIGEPWHYRFFVDLRSEIPFGFDQLNALLEPHTDSMRILGIYAPGKNHLA